VIELLQDPVQQDRLAQSGRLLAERCYDWQVVLKKMDAIFRFQPDPGGSHPNLSC
jgi:hypothetical protein